MKRIIPAFLLALIMVALPALPAFAQPDEYELFPEQTDSEFLEILDADDLMGEPIIPDETDPALLDQQVILDEAGLLSSTELAFLNQQALLLSLQYECGVYAITVNDYLDYSQKSIYECAKDLFRNRDLGMGEDQSGILLLLSMTDRDYALIAHGDFGNTAFTDYGKSVLEEEFLDDFRDNDWYDGLEDYIESCGSLMKMADAGDPLDAPAGWDDPMPQRSAVFSAGALALIVLAPCGLALVVCLIFLSQMKTAVKRTSAEEYVPENGVELWEKEDVFAYASEHREVIRQNRGSGGGTSVDSDGFSGSSGKF